MLYPQTKCFGSLVMAVGGRDGRVYLINDTNTAVVGRYPIRLPLNSGAIESVAFNSKSRYLLTSNSRGNISLWDLKRKVVCREFKGHAPGRVRKAIFDQHDEHVVSGGATGKVLLHNIRSGSVSLELQHPINRSAVEYCCIPGIDSGFSHMLASSHSNGKIHLWDISNNSGGNKAVVTWQAHSRQPAIAIDVLHDQPVLMSAGGNGKVEMFDLRDRVGVTAGQSFICSSMPLTSINAHESESLVLIGSSNGQIHVLDLRQRGETKTTPVMVTKRINGSQESITGVKWQRTKVQDDDDPQEENDGREFYHSHLVAPRGSNGPAIECHGEANHSSECSISSSPAPPSLTCSSSVVSERASNDMHVNVQVLRQVVRDIIEESRGQLHNDIQNLHLDMLKQFHQQADEFQQLLKPHMEVFLHLTQENK